MRVIVKPYLTQATGEQGDCGLLSTVAHGAVLWWSGLGWWEWSVGDVHIEYVLSLPYLDQWFPKIDLVKC